ncbi:hypothetical protein BB560_000844 [Smittium megazygosporum]|uniref:Small ribosomal subunit protein uS2 n=1 Tax=Smittium megazygosporum TaxID=133381 RepID=A0A2T9ZJ82_9FUNG|nr:hypothetical protein BB560_000844 [Smittium megazygosporum]
MANVPAALNATESDIKMLLAAKAHLGTTNADKHMAQYIHKRRVDGVHLINPGKTYEKIVLAARVIAAIENHLDVVVISARPYGQRAVLKYANNTGAQAIAGRFTPGNFTNYNTRQFKEPRLIIVSDPRADHQAVTEASYVNIPVIAFCNSDSPTKHVDIVIPLNNSSKHAIGLGFWLLAREVLRIRGTLKRTEPWSVMVDMFFYRDPEETEKDQEVASGDQDKIEYEQAEPSTEWDAKPSADAGNWEPATTADWAESTTTTDWAADSAGASGWNA